MIQTVEKILLHKALPTDADIINFKITYENGEVFFVPEAEGNRHYDEIMRQVNAGTLTIQEAE